MHLLRCEVLNRNTEWVRGVRESYQHVIRRYPQKAHVIRSLLLQDQKFRGICEDYEAAREAVEWWSRSSQGQAKLRAAEFETVSAELEIEIEHFLNENGV